MTIVISSEQLTLETLKLIHFGTVDIKKDSALNEKLAHSQAIVNQVINNDAAVYGINTGFGSLANTSISNEDILQLQENIVLSHAVGTGEFLEDEVVRLIYLLKIASLSQAYSGVRPELIDYIIAHYNSGILPCIPTKGSVGASGDLAPLAHLSAALIGYGKVKLNDEILDAEYALELVQLAPIQLAAKEGLALLNGTQVSTALALSALFKLENIFASALLTGSLSVDAAAGSDEPFSEGIHRVRGHQGQIDVAAIIRTLLTDSEIRNSHIDCDRVQDPYSLRCQPQVMGACLDHIRFATKTLVTEANAVSDNPLVFADEEKILSGGNFHAEPVALASDMLAIVIAEIGAIAERRIALLVDPHFSSLPAFLVESSGINSGFMMAQVTAAALASENKSLAHPASVDSIPTSANQEDHVSMATFAARRLHDMLDNTMTIIAIELLAACQGVELRQPQKTSPTLQNVLAMLRKEVPFYKEDRFFAPDIESAKQMIAKGDLNTLFKANISTVLLDCA